VREKEIIIFIIENKIGIFLFFYSCIMNKKVILWFSKGHKFIFLSYS
jgi:hypothetical protein